MQSDAIPPHASPPPLFVARGTRSRVSHVLEQTQRRAELDEPSVLSDRRLPSRKIAKSFIAEPRKRKVFPGKLSRRHPSLSVLTHPSDHLEFSSFSLLTNPRERVNRASILKMDGHRKETRDNFVTVKNYIEEDRSLEKEKNWKTRFHSFAALLPIVEKCYASISGFQSSCVPGPRLLTRQKTRMEGERERGCFNDFLRMSVFHGSVLNL